MFQGTNFLIFRHFGGWVSFCLGHLTKLLGLIIFQSFSTQPIISLW
jgi:hypothetical protein